MQLESKHIYQATAEQWNLDPDLVKSVGDAVFRELSELQRNPPDLILHVRGLGRRFVRRSKLIDKIEKLLLDKRCLAEGKQLKYGRTSEHVEQEEKMLFGLRERYEAYLDEKYRMKEVRQNYTKNHENPETPVQSPVPEEPVRKAGTNNQSECPGIPAGEPESLCNKDQPAKAEGSH